jgi:hypothetical protein
MFASPIAMYTHDPGSSFILLYHLINMLFVLCFLSHDIAEILLKVALNINQSIQCFFVISRVGSLFFVISRVGNRLTVGTSECNVFGVNSLLFTLFLYFFNLSLHGLLISGTLHLKQPVENP